MRSDATTLRMVMDDSARPTLAAATTVAATIGGGPRVANHAKLLPAERIGPSSGVGTALAETAVDGLTCTPRFRHGRHGHENRWPDRSAGGTPRARSGSDHGPGR